MGFWVLLLWLLLSCNNGPSNATIGITYTPITSTFTKVLKNLVLEIKKEGFFLFLKMPCCWAGALPRVCAALHADVLQVDDAAPRAGGHREVLCVPRLCAVTDVRGEVEEVAVLCLPCSAHWPAAFRLGFHSWDCPVCVSVFQLQHGRMPQHNALSVLALGSFQSAVPQMN